MHSLRFVLAVALAASACAGRQAGHIDGGVLGRVVVYRNGVAFYERTAHVTDGKVAVHVPRDRVDDFLKSLTVVDARTQKPLVVTIPRQQAYDGNYLEMTLETPTVSTADVLLTYVTEAPAWKPSYRVVVGANDKVMLEGWAIVDNTTSEDWKGVLVGVGASSALAFRYDLWSVRQVDRDLLAGEDRFALAPPTAVSPYEVQAEELAMLPGSVDETSHTVDGINTSAHSFSGSTLVGEVVMISDSAPAIAPDPNAAAKAALVSRKAMVADVLKRKRDVVIEVHAVNGTIGEAQQRGEKAAELLVDAGLPATRIHIVPKLGSNHHGTRILSVAQAIAAKVEAPGKRDLGSDTPVGESHFMVDRPMTVRAGSSAMVSMVRSETTGGVVYLYDPISERGDDRFAFKAVRLDNPTGQTLEAGPVTVYGDGRFIGEGITEAVLPHASVVVPFALDKQVIVERVAADTDRIAKIVTVQRGVMTAEVQHRREATFTITSRSNEPTRVYLRHRLQSGWTMIEAPSKFTRVGDSQLFEVDLAPHGTARVAITEATPVQRTLELGSDEALGMMRVYVDDPGATPALRAQLAAVLETHRAGADLTDRIATLREQLAEYRARGRELDGQILSLKGLRSSANLAASLRSRAQEISQRVQTTTLAVVNAQEQLMVTRVKLANQLADLRLSDATKPAISAR